MTLLLPKQAARADGPISSQDLIPIVRPRRLRWSKSAKWRTVAFFALYLGYGSLGYRLVVQQHVVVGDAVSRLAHAFFVFYGAPPKVVSIGFVWPPLMTAVFLPFAAIKPLATSLAAMPLTSAFFAALLVVSLERILARLGCGLWLRLALVGLFAVNPMTVFYATNGMAEIVYLTFLVLGTEGFIRWCNDAEPRNLIYSGLLLAVGVMTRYEVVFWFMLLAASIPVVMWRHHADAKEIEGALITFTVPTIFALLLWTFFNWTILGQPFYWINNETPTFGQSLNSSGHGTAPAAHLGAAEIARTLVTLNLRLFVLTIPVALALLAFGLFRRHTTTLVVTGIVLVNPIVTGLLVFKTGAPNFFQLRYNMRAMPLAVIGVGWLLFVCTNRRSRTIVAVAAIGLLAVALPLTWNTMKTFPIQFEEQAFTRALFSGRSQEGTVSVVQYTVGIDHEKSAASWINTHIKGKHEILTDDAQSYDLMLLSGNPYLFLDRIDVGDARWHRVLNNPFGRVGYVVVSRIRPIDLVNERYPRLLRGGLPGFRLVYENPHWALFKVANTPPTRGGWSPSSPIGRGLATSLNRQRFQRRSPLVGDLIDPLLGRARIDPDHLDRAVKATFNTEPGARSPGAFLRRQ